MEKVKGDVIYCFSEGEFSIVADVCGIRKMLCFTTREGGQLRKLPRNEYNRAVFDLCKRGMVRREGNDLILDKELAVMITRCKKSGRIVCFRKKTEHSYTACIYLDDDMDYTVILPGRRKSEYIRMSSHANGELRDMLESCMDDGDEVYVYDGTGMQLLQRLSREKEDSFTVDELVRHLKGE